jgi:hypothetical protein
MVRRVSGVRLVVKSREHKGPRVGAVPAAMGYCGTGGSEMKYLLIGLALLALIPVFIAVIIVAVLGASLLCFAAAFYPPFRKYIKFTIERNSK